MLMDTISRLKHNLENIQADLASTIKKPTSQIPVKVIKHDTSNIKAGPCMNVRADDQYQVDLPSINYDDL